MGTTNVMPSDLNFDRYEGHEYDEEIGRVIPGHRDLHMVMMDTICALWKSDKKAAVLDLGAGTGLTSEAILTVLPKAKLSLVDFSKHMLRFAKQRLGAKASYRQGDYAELDFPPASFDLVVSVIGFHHQTDQGKQEVMRKVYKSLRRGGIFVLGDLVTHRDKYQAAVAKARHFHYLVERASSPEKLREWAYHHEYLNDLASLEDIQEWLEQVGFQATVPFAVHQTALVIGRKA